MEMVNPLKFVSDWDRSVRARARVSVPKSKSFYNWWSVIQLVSLFVLASSHLWDSRLKPLWLYSSCACTTVLLQKLL